MPSGPKKRKGAKKKKKELEHAAPDVQEECVDFEHVADKVESMDESTLDSVLTVEAAELPAPEILDSKVNERQEEDYCPETVASQQPLPLQEVDSLDKTTETVIPTNAASEEKQLFLSHMEQLERLRRTVIEVVQATENMTILVHKLLDDLNNFQLTAGQ